MTRFEEISLEERAVIPNIMQPSPKNSIKRVEIDNKRLIHALKMNNKYNIKRLQGRNLLTQYTKYKREDII